MDNLEKLGPTFTKLGQIMSIRPDVLPPPIMKELAKLQVGVDGLWVMGYIGGS